MTRYVFIDRHSSVIFGDFVAETVAEAAAMMDRDIAPHEPPKTYDLLPTPRKLGSSGYYVFDVTGCDIPPTDNGQDEDQIRRVESLGRFAGFAERKQEDAL